ncbi:MAG: chorismate mutase [Longimicrobiales bacterium]
MSAHGELERLRQEIETLDRDLVALIARRITLAHRIGEEKRAAGLPTLDPPREAAVVRRAARLARENGLPDEDVRAIFWRVIGLCRREQRE